MKPFISLLVLVLVCFYSSLVAQKKCEVNILPEKTKICPSDTLNLLAQLPADTSLYSGYATSGQNGAMFLIVAKNDIVITSIDVHVGETANYSLFYKQGNFDGFEKDSTVWTLLGRAFNVKNNKVRDLTPVPIQFGLRANKGDTISFYISAMNTPLTWIAYDGTQNYGAIYKQNNDLSLHEGKGIAWPFGYRNWIFTPRSFTGQINYYHTTKATYKWSNSDTSASIQVSPKSKTTYIVEASFGSCKTSDTVEIEVEQYNLNLGNDTFMCKGGVIELNAGKLPSGSQVTWKPGNSNAQKVNFFNPGLKRAEVISSIGCIYRDTVLVSDTVGPDISLPKDTFYCEGDSILLEILDTNQDFEFAWSTTNLDTNAIWIKDVGRVNVKVTNKYGCFSNNRVTVAEQNKPNVNLSSQRVLCVNDSIEIDFVSTDSITKVLWSNGMRSNSIYISVSDSYSVTVQDEFGCSNADSAYFKLSKNPKFSINDTALCEGGTLLLNAKSFGPNTKYEWSNGVFSQTNSIRSEGNYSLLIIDSNNCEFTDSFYVGLNKLPNIDLGGNRDLCRGDSILIKPAITSQIIDFDWNSGDTTIDVWVKKEGTYVLNIIDSKNCENFDNIQVTERDNPVLMLPSDSFHCDGDSLLIQVGNYTSIQWSNNSVDSFAYLQKGIHWVKVENEFGCQKTDSISISEMENVEATFSYEYVDEQKVEFINESKNQAESYWKLDNEFVLIDSVNFVHWFKNEGDYTVWLVTKNYCSVDSTSQSITITKSGLYQNNKEFLQVFPNPFENQVVIRSENEVSDIRMNSITGKEIGINTTFSGFRYIVEIPENTPSGIYNLSYTKNGVRVSKTLIKR